jgi:hypothetical protein
MVKEEFYMAMLNDSYDIDVLAAEKVFSLLVAFL